MINPSSPSVHTLLSNLKSTIELVIKFPGYSLVSQYGAIERIRSAIFAILVHGIKQNTNDRYEQLWQLILRLNSKSQKYIHLLQDIYHKEDLRTSVEQWIDQSVITQCLAHQLSSMENEFDLIQQYYYSHAFIYLRAFYQALIICIRTIESNDPSLLVNIDPKLSIADFKHDEIPTNRTYANTVTSIENKKASVENIPERFDLNARQRILHRRIHSDPIFYFPNASAQNNQSSMTSSIVLEKTHPLDQDETFADTSYSYEWGSNYDSRADSSVSIEQSLLVKSNRPSISSQTTLVEENKSQSSLSTRVSTTAEITRTVSEPSASLFWPRRGQTLDNYIRECDSQIRTDVEKENAHFYFSEAIISAVEYIKCTDVCRKYFQSPDDQYAVLNYLTSTQPPSNTNARDLSAEQIAFAIMNTWDNWKIPPTPDLFWQIPHEEETVDETLPIQNTQTIGSSNDDPPILRRTNSQWTPPYEQLIFHIHRSVSRDSQLKKQGHLCAGCGRDAEKGFTHRFRYCEYTGKYFCRSCHSDKKFYLPSYIITKWEFSNKHSVSNFAFDYLNRIYTEAIFNINDLNSKLFEKSNKLRLMDELRWALYHLQQYIFTCRFAEEKSYQDSLQRLPSYIYEQPHIYSLEDLVKTKLGELHKTFEPIVNTLREHVFACSLCYAKGFICEICRNEKQILFPFDIQTTSVCPVCQLCLHIRCHEIQKYQCPKCLRTQQRNLTPSDC